MQCSSGKHFVNLESVVPCFLNRSSYPSFYDSGECCPPFFESGEWYPPFCELSKVNPPVYESTTKFKKRGIQIHEMGDHCGRTLNWYKVLWPSRPLRPEGQISFSFNFIILYNLLWTSRTFYGLYNREGVCWILNGWIAEFSFNSIILYNLLWPSMTFYELL